VVIVKKKEGSYRLCVDYRKINSKIINDAFPLPRVEDVLTKAAKFQVFTRLDLKSGFYQIPLRKSDQKYLAFAVGSELLSFTCLPFGMKTSPSIFCRTLCDVLRPFNHFCVIYVDDVLILSHSVQQHKLDVRAIVSALARAYFRIAISKCLLFTTQVPFLGHLVTHGHILQDLAKTKAISEIPLPASFKALRSFIGAINSKFHS